MIGWINLSVERFIVKTFGEAAWNKVVAESGVQVGWVSSCPYPDKVTYDIVITAAGILGVSVSQALEAYGVFFVDYVTEQGYTKLLKTLGSNIVELLSNLNNLHLHLTMGQPAMDAPAFRVDHVTSTSLHLHYFSKRPALWPIVVGVLKGLAKQYLDYELEVSVLENRDDGADHEVFLLKFPLQENVTVLNSAVTANTSLSTTGFTFSPEAFCQLHPFHMLLDKNMQLVQLGPVLPRLVPGIAIGAPVATHFQLRHPLTSFDWDGLSREVDTVFVLSAAKTGMELKGQMIPTTVPIPGCPVPKDVMLFLASPRCSNLDEMMKYNLFLSDIPLHDLSRDFVLLAEQRQAEADLKEKFEKLMLDLKEEKARSDALVQRMSGLLACFPFKASDKKAGGKKGGADKGDDHDNTMLDESLERMDVIEAVRRTLDSMNLKQSEAEAIEIICSIGEGTYGKVYKALWQGTEVALKTIVLPANMSGSEKREKMAVMEAAISSSLSHPNIVQTYTYSINPLRDSAIVPEPKSAGHSLIADGRRPFDGTMEGGGSGSQSQSATQNMTMGQSVGQTTGTFMERPSNKKGAIHSYEVKLVLELCDKGSLRDALEQRAFFMPDVKPPLSGGTADAQLDPVNFVLNYRAVIDTAMDIAKAFIHLHCNNVLHCDLKARNVLLRAQGGSSGRGVIAKIGDFGLALKLPEDDDHLSNIFQGTLTHMAPEVLSSGQVSKASDVYAFAITLWELFTGGHAFKGVPRALLGHQVTVEHRRPDFPVNTPPRFKQLAEWCWNKDPRVRPTFEEILAVLVTMRKDLKGATPPLQPFNVEAAPEEAIEDAAPVIIHSTTLKHAPPGTMSASGAMPSGGPGLAQPPAHDPLGGSMSFVPTDSEGSSSGGYQDEDSDY